MQQHSKNKKCAISPPLRGNRLVLINRDETPYDGNADLVLHESLGDVFSQFA